MIKRIISALTSATLVAGGVLVYTQTRAEPLETYRVTADVEQAPNLFSGGRVMVRGVKVGVITNVVPRPGGVRLTMEIEKGTKIPSSARLAVVPITVISDRYVQFTPAYEGGALLENGDHLNASRTSIPAELEDVLTQVRDLMAALEPKKDQEDGPLTSLIRDLNFALEGNTAALSGSLENTATVLGNLAANDGEIASLIRRLDKLFVVLADRSSEIALVNQRFRLVAQTLAKDRRDLEGTIENLAFLSEQGSKLVGETGDRLGEELADANVVIQGILEHQDALVEGVRWTNVIAQALGEVDDNGRGLFAYTGKVAEPGAPGSEYNYRLEVRDTIACGRLKVLADAYLRLFPGSGITLVRISIMDFVPEAYRDDIAHLIDQLLGPCTGLEVTTAPLAGDRAALNEAIDEYGEERFRRFIGVWLLQTIAAMEDGA